MPQATPLHPKLHIELDVTPRWFAPTEPGFYEDGAAILAALGAYEGPATRLAVDTQLGATGVRLVLVVPAGQPTDGFEAERRNLQALLDALDGVSPRRARVTAARARAAEEQAAREKAAAEAERAAKPPVPPLVEAPQPSQETPATRTPDEVLHAMRATLAQGLPIEPTAENIAALAAVTAIDTSPDSRRERE